MEIHKQISNEVHQMIESKFLGERNNVKTRESIISETTKILEKYITSGDVTTIESMVCDDTNNPYELITKGGVVITINFVGPDGQKYQIDCGIRNSTFTENIINNNSTSLLTPKMKEWSDKQDLLNEKAFTSNFKNGNICVDHTFTQLFKTIDKFSLDDFDFYNSGEILAFNVNYQDDGNNALLSEIIADFDVYKELTDHVFGDCGLDADELSLNPIISYMEAHLNETVFYKKKNETFYLNSY